MLIAGRCPGISSWSPSVSAGPHLLLWNNKLDPFTLHVLLEPSEAFSYGLSDHCYGCCMSEHPRSLWLPDLKKVEENVWMDWHSPSPNITSPHTQILSIPAVSLFVLFIFGEIISCLLSLLPDGTLTWSWKSEPQLNWVTESSELCYETESIITVMCMSLSSPGRWLASVSSS